MTPKEPKTVQLFAALHTSAEVEEDTTLLTINLHSASTGALVVAGHLILTEPYKRASS